MTVETEAEHRRIKAAHDLSESERSASEGLAATIAEREAAKQNQPVIEALNRGRLEGENQRREQEQARTVQAGQRPRENWSLFPSPSGTHIDTRPIRPNQSRLGLDRVTP